jgi:hypothetical protein
MGLKPDPRQGLAFTVDGEENDSKERDFSGSKKPLDAGGQLIPRAIP